MTTFRFESCDELKAWCREHMDEKMRLWWVTIEDGEEVPCSVEVYAMDEDDITMRWVVMYNTSKADGFIDVYGSEDEAREAAEAQSFDKRILSDPSFSIEIARIAYLWDDEKNPLVSDELPGGVKVDTLDSYSPVLSLTEAKRRELL